MNPFVSIASLLYRARRDLRGEEAAPLCRMPIRGNTGACPRVDNILQTTWCWIVKVHLMCIIFVDISGSVLSCVVISAVYRDIRRYVCEWQASRFFQHLRWSTWVSPEYNAARRAKARFVSIICSRRRIIQILTEIHFAFIDSTCMSVNFIWEKEGI